MAIKKDNLHFSWTPTDGYNKTFNFAICEREAGKSVASWLKIWSVYNYKGQPSLILRRLIADITTTYIDDIETLLNKFLETPVQLVYRKGSIREGIIDVKIGEYGKDYSWQAAEKLPVFFRLIGLSNPMSRIKSLMLKNVAYIFFDEFICNLRDGEKYLKSEYFKIQEIFTTYNRESSTGIKCYFAGNPYSVFCAMFSGLDVDTRKLKPGSLIVGPNYVINCFVIPEELKQIILANNPLYQFDDAYKRYAFDGEAINDANIKIMKQQPSGYKLFAIFKQGKQYLTVFRNGSEFWTAKRPASWFEKNLGKRSKIHVFDFADMMEQTYIVDNYDMKNFSPLKDAMKKGKIYYNCVDASYILEDIYYCI